MAPVSLAQHIKTDNVSPMSHLEEKVGMAKMKRADPFFSVLLKTKYMQGIQDIDEHFQNTL